jgi:hypothetical protein
MMGTRRDDKDEARGIVYEMKPQAWKARSQKVVTPDRLAAVARPAFVTARFAPLRMVGGIGIEPMAPTMSR